jgi:hypothetical protein
VLLRPAAPAAQDAVHCSSELSSIMIPELTFFARRGPAGGATNPRLPMFLHTTSWPLCAGRLNNLVPGVDCVFVLLGRNAWLSRISGHVLPLEPRLCSQSFTWTIAGHGRWHRERGKSLTSVHRGLSYIGNRSDAQLTIPPTKQNLPAQCLNIFSAKLPKATRAAHIDLTLTSALSPR